MAVSDFVIDDLTGGQNDTDAPQALANNECVLATNVEFFISRLGERRRGCGPLDITGSGLSSESLVVHISQWFPTGVVTLPEYFVIAATPGVSTTVARRSTALAWSNPSITDALNNSNPDVYSVATQEFNGKFFFAYRSTQDRLHVWDGTTLRRTGLTQPANPSVADEGGGAFTGIRYYRVRYAVLSGAVVSFRSEPSTVTTFSPSGAGAGARITKPASISEGETHWEIEASEDNANFYRIQRLVVGTTTYDDTTVYATGYAGSTLADAIGAYTLQPSAKFLAVDGDRLVWGGHWTDATKQSQIGWSAVSNDPGAGPDERFPITTTGGQNITTFVNLDNYESGPLTGIAADIYGSWYAFKWNHIYKMVRTNDVTRAYDVITISKKHGAIPGSIVRGVDENGNSCIYFLDPTRGPYRIGAGGLQAVVGLRTTWGRVNLQAGSVIARGCYYPYKQQIHWWLAVDGGDRPSLKIVLQTTVMKSRSGNAIGGGWSVWDGRIAQAASVGVLTEIVSISGVASLSDRPFVGLTAPDCIQRCDTESTDNGTAYTATIRTKPYLVAGLLNKWGAMNASILALANSAATVVVKFIRDYGLETNTKTATLTPAASETYVIKDIDDLVMSDAKTIQVEFSDS